MEQVEVHGATSGEGRSNTRGPSHFCSACLIFNVSQLTAAQAGSLVKNATHAATPAWQAHALVVLLLNTGLPNTARIGGRWGSWLLLCRRLSVVTLG